MIWSLYINGIISWPNKLFNSFISQTEQTYNFRLHCLLMFCVVALSSGGVLELPWMLLDPRRPLSSTPELREEPVIPYMPELPTLPEAIINYNQTMFRVRGIHTSPSGLESTCLVFVYGLGQ